MDMIQATNPTAKIPSKAYFWRLGRCKFLRAANGNIPKAKSVAMLKDALRYARTSLLKQTPVGPWRTFQYASTGRQVNIELKRVHVLMITRTTR
jgi:hypothetical protein